jgi:hypothetical protein
MVVKGINPMSVCGLPSFRRQGGTLRSGTCPRGIVLANCSRSFNYCSIRNLPVTKRIRPVGKCLLSGTEGPLVQSHIIPKFLGDKALGQAHRIQYGAGTSPQLLFNSWSDNHICVAKGEERLRDLDTLAARIFRAHGLSWRHFPLSQKSERYAIEDTGVELIKVPGVDTNSLRLFLLSLLWRSAASSRFEFAEIEMKHEDLERLRSIVNGEVEPENSDWPSVLVLHTNKGEPQIHTPLAQTISVKELGLDAPDVPIFRFFLDGLVVHMGRHPGDTALFDTWSDRVVGVSNDLLLIGRPYEGSRQELNLLHLQRELEQTHPEQAERIYNSLESISRKAQGRSSP